MSVRLVNVAFLLFGSGTCALIYQMVWLRELRLVFGASTAASAAVLAIFMGGLGLGGILLGRRADRHERPLLLYAYLELSIAICALATPFLILAVRHVYIWLGGSPAMGIVPATLVRLVLSALVLGLPTFLMGGTLPAAARAIETANDMSRRRVAVLYGFNTIGAVTGVVLATFFMLEIFGARITLWIACLINILIGLAARSMSRSMSLKEAPGKETERMQIQAARPTEGSVPAAFVFGCAGIVGFAFMLMELVWYRMLSPLLGGSTYTFGLILGVALLGMGLGGAAYALRSQTSPPRLHAFALTCGMEALFMAVPYALGDRLAVLAALLRPLGQIGLTGHVIGWFLITGLVVLPAAVVSGYQFPLLISLLGKGRENLGQHIGLTYAWNTGGAIIGSLAGGFLLLPFLTAPGSWKGVVLILTLTGISAGFYSFRYESRKCFLIPPAATLGVALLLILATGPTAAWRHSPIGAGRVDLNRSSRNEIKDWVLSARRDLIWEAEGREVSLGLTDTNGLAFVVNGKIDGNAKGDSPTQVMLGMVSAVLHPAPKKAMVIGLGTGSSAGWLAEIDSITRVDVAELEPDILEVARLCAPVNRNVLSNPKVRTIIADAREVLLTSSEKYDLIVSEPSNPYRAGVASLYTREFYQAVMERLAPGGIFSQWIQAYEIDAQTVRTVYATLASVFPQVETWQTMRNDLLVLCSREPRTHSVPQLRRRLETEPFLTALRVSWCAIDLEGFLSRFVARSSFARTVAGKELQYGWLNTDDRMLVEFGYARTVGRKNVFSPADLEEAARRKGENRLPVSGGDVDWELVDENRLRMYTHEGMVVSNFSWLGKERGLRAKAYGQFLRGNFKAGLDTWEQQPRIPEHPLELALVAEALADKGDSRAIQLVEKLQVLWPVEADAIRARFYWKTKQPEPALQAYMAAFKRLRSDPWPYGVIMSRTLNLALEMAKDNPKAARQLFDLLSVPFSVGIMNESRSLVLLDLAGQLGNPEIVEALKHFEPHLIWKRPFLNKRADVYKKVGDPRAKQAEKDLNEFLMDAPARIGATIH